MKPGAKLAITAKGRRTNNFRQYEVVYEGVRVWPTARKRNRWRMWTEKHRRILFARLPEGRVRTGGWSVKKLKSMRRPPVETRLARTFGRRSPLIAVDRQPPGS